MERVVSPVLPVRSLEEVGGSTLVETPKFCITPESQPEGATWQPMTGPCGTTLFTRTDATCQKLTGPLVYRVISSILPRHCPVSMPLCLSRVTLTVVTRVTL
jgi:hypothetical protein